MRPSVPASAAVLFTLVAGVAACGGPRSTAPAPLPGQDAALTLRVRLPAAFAGTSLAATVFADGARQPATPSASVRLDSSACSVSGGERLCTLRLAAPVGLVDVALRATAMAGASLSGTALRQLLPRAGATVSLAFDGTPSAWSFSPELPAAAADGVAQQVPVALLVRDAQGFALLSSGLTPPATVAVTGDVTHQVNVSAQGGGAFVAAYAGQPVGNVTLSASAPGAAAAHAAFSTLVVNPSSLVIAAGKSATLRASLAHYQGPFEASSGNPNCAVAPASATPAVAGGMVQFTVRLISGAGCSIVISAAQFDVPIVIPAKNAVAEPGIGIGPSKIQHIVIVLQENRSFDNIFGGLDQNGNPFPGADTVSNPNPGEPTPHNHLGNPVAMSTGLLEECLMPLHQHANSIADVDAPTPTSTGKMDGFDLETIIQENCAPSPAPTNYAYRTIEYPEVAPYWQIGEQYAISDRMFEPTSSASYVPHLFFVAGQSGNTIDNPVGGGWGCDAIPGTIEYVTDPANGQELPGVFPCFSNVKTLADELDQRGVSWRYYATTKSDFGYNWSAYRSFSQIFNGPDWSANVKTPPAQIITDVEAGTLAAVTWVTPTNVTSDHPQAHSNLGPAWIASVVNAIGTSQFWDTTAIFISWDDWGGWYDHVPPPVTTPYFSMGVRVPVIIVSPYARPAYVSHVVHSTGSILHFAEEVFDLPSLGEEDARRDDFMDAFNFSQKPTPFKTFEPARSKQEIMRAASGGTRAGDYRDPDE